MKPFNINTNLTSIKCVIFFFFGGLGCLLPFLPMHMLNVGLNVEEARIISIVAPCVALIGPLIVGPLADKFAGNVGSGGNKQAATGKYLRVMMAICLIASAILFSLLMAVPSVARFKARRPSISFTCDINGASVLQERCTEERKCHQWEENKIGSLLLSNCRYTCHTPPSTLEITSLAPTNINVTTSENYDYDVVHESDPGDTSSGYGPLDPSDEGDSSEDDEIPPHLCYKEIDGTEECQAYTGYSKTLNVNISLHQATNPDADHEEWCLYPVAETFECQIPPSVSKNLISKAVTNSCRPIIECDVDDPYDSPNSVMADSQCVQTIGDPSLTFWLYLIIRSVADIFPTAAIVLLDAAVIIATRETSTGRGDVGRQLAWGAMGLALFAPIVGVITDAINPATYPSYSIAIIVFAVLMVISAIILLFSDQMPLSPPEWWWHTKSGMLALPMSTVRRYKAETGALLGVLVLLGIFWSTLDSYLPWHIAELKGSYVLIGLTLTIGMIPAIPVLWFVEIIVDYCGHSNLLITSFTVYIIRYIGLSFITSPWWSLLLESIEVFTLALMWVTAILYLRHLVPRKFTVTGQALAVIAHFCIGRCLGAILGGIVSSGSTLNSLRSVYQGMAIAAAVVATVYFCLYHFLLKPRCAAPTTGPPTNSPSVMQGMNGSGSNGTYTPLRVYHNSRARKGQFRY